MQKPEKSKKPLLVICYTLLVTAKKTDTGY
jgi:hypothetical protein